MGIATEVALQLSGVAGVEVESIANEASVFLALLKDRLAESEGISETPVEDCRNAQVHDILSKKEKREKRKKG